MQSRPTLLVGFPQHLAKGFTGVLQRHHKQERSAVPTGAIQRRCAKAKINLRLFPGKCVEDVEALRLTLAQRAYEALDRVVTMDKSQAIHQILVDALGVAPQRHLAL